MGYKRQNKDSNKQVSVISSDPTHIPINLSWFIENIYFYIQITSSNQRKKTQNSARRHIEGLIVQGSRKRGRPLKTLIEVERKDMECGVDEKMVVNGVQWKVAHRPDTI